MLDRVYLRAAAVVAGTFGLAVLGAWVDEGLGRDGLGMLVIVIAALFCGCATFWYVRDSPVGCAALFLGTFGALVFGIGLGLETNTYLLRHNGIDAECTFEQQLPPPSENDKRWRLRCPGGQKADLTTKRLTRGPDGLVPVRYDPRGRTDAVEAEVWESRSSNPWPRLMLVGGGIAVLCLPFAAAMGRPLDDDSA
ncbi:hypothetical protein [Actinomadura sp. 9N407]|uniref:hypothetical protein n=1 Tax=Actinomadura sp. 9N407 TaxID=3375154 RepID=UPI003789F1B9